jgi:hypothetical protein
MNSNPQTLVAGDVLIIKYSDKWWHSMMIVDNHRIAHAPGVGKKCKVETIDSFIADTLQADSKLTREVLLRDRLFAYRYKGKHKPDWQGWDEFAVQWCDERTAYAPGRPRTVAATDPNWKQYPRNYGVVNTDNPGEDGNVAASLPFGPDALYRTFKWAQRYHRNVPFSQKRGTTCCAFVMACIQSSFVNAAMPAVKRVEAIETVLKVFSEGSDGTPKVDTLKIPALRAPAKHEKGQPHEGGALRANSNRGISDAAKSKFKTSLVKSGRTDLTEGDSATGLWEMLRGLEYYDTAWDAVGLPPSLQHDAKYMYSRVFNHELAKDSANWAPL